uniref:Uncharacterized protein MANES_02G028200 n=1 Tax=Rhizophora mucronata TaxID=61149 RepID=A0A2P2QM21_RHIMU
MQITCRDCSVADSQKEKEETFCLTVHIVENFKNSSITLETIQDMIIPFLLQTVIRGFMEIKKVDILWNDKPRIPRPHTQPHGERYPHGELYLRVSMSEDLDKTKLWNLLVDDCLPIMDKIDWTRSHPDNIRDFCLAFGVDAGWKFFLNNLDTAISDIGKTVLPEHLVLVANSLSVTGEFAGLNATGMKRQRDHASVSCAFVQGCFSSPGNCFIKAAKAGVTDDLQGSLDALSWGKIPPIGTGHFDILFSQDCEFSLPINVYNFLGTQIGSDKQYTDFEVPSTRIYKSEKCGPQFAYKFNGYKPKGFLESLSRSFLRSLLTYNDIHRLSRVLGKILNKYPVNHQLNEGDKSTLMSALYFHPRREDKIGTGAQEIKVVNHPRFKDSKCFSLVRTDGTMEDFSYHKCVHGALEVIAPQKAKMYHDKHFKSRVEQTRTITEH